MSIIDKLRSARVRLPEIQYMGMFGSAASGNMTESSDIDLIVYMIGGRAITPEDKRLYVGIIKAVLNTSRNIDIVDWTVTNPATIDDILMHAITIFGNPPNAPPPTAHEISCENGRLCNDCMAVLHQLPGISLGACSNPWCKKYVRSP